MATLTADVHLKRAIGLIHEVKEATDKFRKSASAHDAAAESDQPFLKGMASMFQSSRELRQQKTSLFNDLQLANQEIDQAAAIDQDADIEFNNATLSMLDLRSITLYMGGQLELIWGSEETAKSLFYNSLQLVEYPEAHYMLGLIYESNYKPAEALRHFERCLDLDPDGEWSISALREANAMRRYKKRFRGSWGLLLFLFVFPLPVPVLWSIVYFFIKWK